jgi:hypothetical protein
MKIYSYIRLYHIIVYQQCQHNHKNVRGFFQISELEINKRLVVICAEQNYGCGKQSVR